MPPTEIGIPSCESRAIRGMRRFPPQIYPLPIYVFVLLLFLVSKSHLQSNSGPGFTLTGK